MIKKTLAVALGAMLMAGSAAAVEVNQGGKGDLLIAPLFLAKDGWQSELKVINTSEEASSVAKVVFHAPGRSEEILDFLIFLSPGDVWTGTVVENADGTVGVTSSDSSAVTVRPVSVTSNCPAPVGVTGFDSTKAKFTRSENRGYINIFQARMLPNLTVEPDGTVKKETILKAYSEACVDSINNPITADSTENVLTGSVTVSNPLNGNRLTLGMTALAGYNNLEYLTAGTPTTFATSLAATRKSEVEDALWASNFVVPYNVAAGNLSFAAVTFPTKESFISSFGTQYGPFLPAANDAESVRNGVGTPVFAGYSIRDEEEHLTSGCSFSPCASTTLPRELNLIQFVPGTGVNTADQAFTGDFTKGWANLVIAPVQSVVASNANYNNLNQAGSPALVTYIHWDMTGGSLQGTWQYAAKTYAPAVNR